jgi:signal transduction histidine kinase
MNCVTPMPSATNVVEPEAADPDRARFYADLATGLHAMAQPLTVLRAAIEVLVLPEGRNIDQRRYLEISSRQLARTCGMFASLQDLVAARMIENQRPLLLAAGVGIAAVCDEPSASICGDAERTEQTLVALLNLAACLSSRGDVIELRTIAVNDFVELTLENTRCHGKRLDSSHRLSLAVAEANILSQHGRYALIEDPFRVSLVLPVEELVDVTREAELSHQDAQPVR